MNQHEKWHVGRYQMARNFLYTLYDISLWFLRKNSEYGISWNDRLCITKPKDEPTWIGRSFDPFKTFRAKMGFLNMRRRRKILSQFQTIRCDSRNSSLFIAAWQLKKHIYVLQPCFETQQAKFQETWDWCPCRNPPALLQAHSNWTSCVIHIYNTDRPRSAEHHMLFNKGPIRLVRPSAIPSVNSIQIKTEANDRIGDQLALLLPLGPSCILKVQQDKT
jgi:hypothetical protein